MVWLPKVLLIWQLIQSAFLLLSLGRHLLPLTTLNRHQSTGSSGKFFLPLHEGMYLLSDIEYGNHTADMVRYDNHTALGFCHDSLNTLNSEKVI